MQLFILPCALLGLCIGSFLNVVIYRLPRRESIIFRRSNCPKCKNNLGAFELVPVLSWFFLRGRCLNCNSSISWRYPLVEILTSISFLICFHEINNYSNNFSFLLFKLFFGFILVSLLVTLSFIDIDHMILPHKITFLGAILGLLYSILYNVFFIEYANNSFINYFFAYLLGFFSIFIFNIFITFLFNKTGIGTGDAFLFAMSGAWLGLSGLEVVIVFSFILSGFFSIIGILINRIRKGSYIPLGPFICISIFIVWIFKASYIINVFPNIFWWRYF